MGISLTVAVPNPRIHPSPPGAGIVRGPRSHRWIAAGCLSVWGATVARAQDPEHGFADKRAVQLMDRVEAKMRAASTIEAVKRSTLREPTSGKAGGWRLLKIRLQRPSKYRVEVLDMDEQARKGFMYPFRLSDGTLRLSERFDRRDPKTGKYDPNLDPKLWQRNRYIERTGDDDIYRSE